MFLPPAVRAVFRHPPAASRVRLTTVGLLLGLGATSPAVALQAQATPVQTTAEYLQATWYTLFKMDPEGLITGAPRICVDTHGLAIGEPDPRNLASLTERDTTTVPFLESIGQYVVDAAACWADPADTAYATLYIQGSVTRRASGSDSVAVALFQLFPARPCANTVTPRCAVPAPGATTIYVTGKIRKATSGWPPLPLRRTTPGT